MSTIRSLFLAANPLDRESLSLDKEYREITEKIRASDLRDSVEFVSTWATRPDDLLHSLNRYKPDIVHFSGHGTTEGEIMLVDSKGRAKPIPPEALKALFATLKDNIQLVILNSCYSQKQAEAITELIDYAICMQDQIGDEAAIVFIASFYRALGYGRTIEEAFEQGKVSLLLEDVPTEAIPMLIKKVESPRKRFPARNSKPPKEPTPKPSLDLIHRFQHPFGEIACENEIKLLQDDYRNYYYDQSRFNACVLDFDRYLIVGRRGSGKTSLTQFFKFQERIRNTQCISSITPEEFDDLLREVAQSLSRIGVIGISRLVKLWEYIFWMLIFNELRKDEPQFDNVCYPAMMSNHAELGADDILYYLWQEFSETYEHHENRYIERFLQSQEFIEAQEMALSLAQKRPIVISIDTMEKYDIDDDLLMKSTAALIECASHFNIAYARRGIHIKAFIAAEIFPHIRESVISNTTKHIRNPIYLHWRPKDLIRLICWRFYCYLKSERRFRKYVQREPNWDDFDDVLQTMWYPFFGERLVNGSNREESTFPYILRHTQMRPRQLVYLCNEIAREAVRAEVFPIFNTLPLAEIVNQGERTLSDEVLNSYSKIYPQVSEIIDALRSSPRMFPGSYLDKVAKYTASSWPTRDSYSLGNFRRLVAELGIVGRVRSHDPRTGIVTADFEYTLEERLALRSDDQCVIHPMFHAKLQTERTKEIIVYPFPDHPDFSELQNR